jgi:hypothetical protein
MAKNIDYSKIKAMAASILECIGEDEEGENPSLPKQQNDIDDGGQDSQLKFLPDDTGTDKKKDKGATIGLMASALANKFKK